MKKKGLQLRGVLCVCAALGWWSFLYPQLSMTQDTYNIVCEDETVQESVEKDEWDFDSDIFHRILEAEDGTVRLRSRFLTMLEAYFKERK